MKWSKHRHAAWYLGGMSFAESSFFPIPVDVMLAPMALAKPNKAWHYATIATVTSVLGGIFGYLVGMFLFDIIGPLIERAGHQHSYETAQAWFADWGFWAIFVAGFAPIPYKIFTITAGTLSMALLPFIVASIIGRGSRFFLVAGLMRWGGERMERLLRQHIDRIGWAVVGLAVVAYFFIRQWK